MFRSGEKGVSNKTVIFSCVVFVGIVFGVCMWAIGGLHITPAIAAPLTAEQFQQQSDRITKIFHQNGVSASFTYVKQEMAQSPSFARDCHPLLHILGNEAFHYYGSFQTALGHTNEVCNSGYVHGVIEAYAESVPDAQSALLAVCGDGTEPETYQQWECYHGVGHGLMLAYGKVMPFALSACAKLPTTYGQTACANGVLMEHFIVVTHIGNVSPKIHVGLKDCQAPVVLDKADCYLYAPGAFLASYAGNYTQAFRNCSQDAVAYEKDCDAGVGLQAMTDMISKPAGVAQVCKQAGSQDGCVSGAITEYMNYNSSSKTAESICNGTLSFDKSACEAAIQRFRSLYNI